MSSKPKSERSLKSFLRELERDGGGDSAYAAILRETVSGEDLRRTQLDEANDLARRQAEHAPREQRGG